MSEINYQALREKAEKATKGSYIVGHTSVNQHGNLTGVFVCQKWKGEPGGVIAECHVNCLIESDAQAYANAEFIAEANPATVLALLDEQEAQSKRIAELETNLAALAAENAAMHETIEAVRGVADNSSGIAGWHLNGDIATWEEILPEINDIETPATDAFLSEVRAQGVDAAIEAAKNLVAQEYEYKDFKAAQSDCCMHPGSDLVGKVEMTEWLVDFAAQLRKGGNQ
ncbi:TPA: ead/Ea22-like family protein [Escherichia coli]|uniref:ead/Ea22-like family protein n=4 Tax=Escherichia coli TaxID=562 RepID=UPI0003EF5DCE|nr:ead/Ea22-like family protein [Escherichia coli]EES5468187.1 ead/Ea22-like family protein [Escherichia coli]EET8596934.1 ead/Ea22-like family protein [Escherichia coli]EEX6463797.1 ead/Ea22-like family protein [Escherichia coli]EEY9961954.1 ead/Ea22-like family protein [Escherichia coli]EEZ7953381.1 ead/Ea22-like family protein [Escherichia coli]